MKYINNRGELLAFKLTSGNIDDWKLVFWLREDLINKLLRYRGHIF
ncbi:MAG: hypothetical protein JJP05_07490 [cyanobacterium endosymbiont of Rhopalodia gibba]